MDKQLHIVCFDAPSPPDYGGAIDLFYKIVALAEAGVAITLHYFGYRQERHHEGLEQYCHRIFVYNRKQPWQCLHSPLPYIVASRINTQLVERLNTDSHPILLEGVHTTGIIPYLKDKSRTLVVRIHNNEAAYYQRLAHAETNVFRNLYYIVESTRLFRFQQKLPKTISYAALSKTDQEVLSTQFGLPQTSFVPCFIPWKDMHTPEYTGDFCLYHGNLGVSENSAVVKWLLKNVFTAVKIPFVVAGKNPPASLRKAIAQLDNARLVENPTDTELADLVEKAQVHVLPSLNETGVKLKLLHALFRGRHCLTNKEGVAGSGLEELVHIADDDATMQQTIQKLWLQPLTQKEVQQRATLLHLYNNEVNANKLIASIWKRCQ